MNIFSSESEVNENQPDARIDFNDSNGSSSNGTEESPSDQDSMCQLETEDEALPTVWKKRPKVMEWSGFNYRMWAKPGTYKCFLKPQFSKYKNSSNGGYKRKKYSRKNMLTFAIYIETQPTGYWVQTENMIKSKQSVIQFTVPSSARGVVLEQLATKEGAEVILMVFNMRETSTYCDLVLKRENSIDTPIEPVISVLHTSYEISNLPSSHEEDSYDLRDMDIVADEALSKYESTHVEDEVMHLINALDNEEEHGIEGAVPLQAGKARVLAMDGGGSRGAGHAIVLKKLEELTGMKSCQMFDMISGTSTGGLVAGAVFHLRFSATFMLEFYRQTAKALFYDVFPGKRTKRLRSLASSLYGEGRLMAFNQYPFVAIVSMRTEVDKSLPEAFIFRNYDPNDKHKIGSMLTGSAHHPGIHAMTSTAAAYPLVKAPTFGNYKFFDGGLIANNPAEIALRELRAVSARGPASDGNSVGFILSLGTGIPDATRPSSFLTRIAPTLTRMLISVFNRLTGVENVDIFCREAFNTPDREASDTESSDEYIRLEGPNIGSDFSIDIHGEKLNEYLTVVEQYLSQPKQKKSLEDTSAQILALSVFLSCKKEFDVGYRFIGIITPRTKKVFFPKQFNSQPLDITLQHKTFSECTLSVTVDQSEPIIVNNRQLMILRSTEKLTVSGEYVLSIKRNNIHIAGSPLTINVNPGPLDILCSGFSGPLISGGEEGEWRRLVVEGRDQFDNHVPISKEKDDIVMDDYHISSKSNLKRYPDIINQRAVFHIQLSDIGEHKAQIRWKRSPNTTYQMMACRFVYIVLDSKYSEQKNVDAL